ncbi:MAG: transporter permease [Anaerocolumna sp.]|jgi:NitT/TauT family transport system permease protein|nr:transporter permease [Anaerocolumna sp.]
MSDRKKKDKNSPFDYRTVIPIIAIALTLLTDTLIPNHLEAKYRELTDFRLVLIVAFLITIAFFILSLIRKSFRLKYAYKGWFLGGLITFFNILNIITVKLLLLPQIYFPSLNRILNVYVVDYKFLLTCLASSFSLLIEGLLIGTIIGIITGILIGWSKKWSYWIYPIIRILGPIPSSTWIPLALIAFPTPRWAAIFLIAFGVWFQITILTSSGIQSVKKSYFEVSSTLGASNLQNLFRIAIPDALPSMFLGFFNATCSSFVALMAAEMLGCKSGIGWYINWQKEMLSYPNVYAGLIIIAGFCYLFITIQFKVRDKLLGWQKGVIKW